MELAESRSRPVRTDLPRAVRARRRRLDAGRRAPRRCPYRGPLLESVAERIEIELTRQQFGADEVVGAGWAVPPPADMRPGRCVEQGQLLRRRVFAALGGVPIDATTPSSH